jgi:amidase
LELVDAAIRRIEKLNPQLNAVVWERFEKARAEARGSLPGGPFRGVPFLTKDLGCTTEGEPDSQGSRFLKNRRYVSRVTTELARRIRAAGFINLGRTNSPEFGLMGTTEPVAWGPTRNPWDPSRTPGGSSGGSGAAVAALLVPAAHGSDGGGSIRYPAAACGLVGLKPSRGRVSIAPADDFTVPVSVQGFLTRSVRDTAACLDFAAGAAPGDPVVAPPPARPYMQECAADPGKLRIGMLNRLPKWVSGDIDPNCRQAVESAGKLLESLGHRVEMAHPPGIDDEAAANAWLRIFSMRVYSSFRSFEQRLGVTAGPDEIELPTRALFEAAKGLSGIDYVGALNEMNTFSRGFAAWWTGGFDLLLTPVTGTIPPKLGGEYAAQPVRWATFGRFFNSSGQPAISLPLHWTPDGLPIGIQLGAAWGREDLLIRVAAQLERARPWAGRMPKVHA